MRTKHLPHSPFPLQYLIVSSLVAACLSFAALKPAAADVRYTMTMQMGQNGSGGNGSFTPQMHRTVLLKDRRQREEVVMNIGPMTMDKVTLTECDKQQVIQLDPTLKLYTVEAMDSALTSNVAMSMGPQRNQRVGQSSGTGKMVSTISVQDMGTEKVADLDTHHFMMTMHMQTSGCAGNADTSTKMEMWVAPIKAGLDCPEMFSPSRAVTTDSGCQMSVVQNGDLSAMHAMYGGMPVRMKIYNGDSDKAVVEMDMTDYSTAALDPAMFDVPADYKQVSQADFDKAQQQAMMNSMRGGMSQGDTPPPDSSGSGDQSDQNNSDQSSGSQNNNNQNKHHGFSLPRF